MTPDERSGRRAAYEAEVKRLRIMLTMEPGDRELRELVEQWEQKIRALDANGSGPDDPERASLG